jgi:hypothetical protein
MSIQNTSIANRPSSLEKIMGAAVTAFKFVAIPGAIALASYGAKDQEKPVLTSDQQARGCAVTQTTSSLLTNSYVIKCD